MARSSCATSTTGPAGLGLLWWPRRSILTATVHSLMSLYFYNLRINFISRKLQTLFLQHFITVHMCEHGTFVHFANTCFTLFIFSILFCLLVVQRREMHEETACIPKAYCMQKYAPDWTIWGPKLKKVLEKSPPTPSPRSVATLPRKVAIILGIFYFKCWEVCIKRSIYKTKLQIDLYIKNKHLNHKHLNVKNELLSLYFCYITH